MLPGYRIIIMVKSTPRYRSRSLDRGGNFVSHSVMHNASREMPFHEALPTDASHRARALGHPNGNFCYASKSNWPKTKCRESCETVFCVTPITKNLDLSFLNNHFIFRPYARLYYHHAMMMMLSLSSASSLSVVVYYRATGSPLRRSLYILMTVAFISFALICQSSFRVESIKRHMESMAGVSVEDEEDGTVKWVKEGRQDAFSNAPPKQQLRYHATHLTIPSLRRIPSFGASKSHPSVTEETDSKPKFKKESSTANQQAVAFPPLESLVLPTNATKEQFRQGPPPYPSDEHYIVGNVSGLLDFAILGHAKTASTYLSRWFSEHPDMLIWEDEVCDLYNMMPAQLVRRLYNEFPKNTNTQTYQRGFKCPGHFSQRSMAYFSRFFHKTKLIVGVRHPGKNIASTIWACVHRDVCAFVMSHTSLLFQYDGSKATTTFDRVIRCLAKATCLTLCQCSVSIVP